MIRDQDVDKLINTLAAAAAVGKSVMSCAEVGGVIVIGGGKVGLIFFLVL